MIFKIIRKPHSYTEYLEGLGRVLSQLVDISEYQLFKLDRKSSTWIFAMSEDDEPLPKGSLPIDDAEIIKYNKAKALLSFW